MILINQFLSPRENKKYLKINLFNLLNFRIYISLDFSFLFLLLSRWSFVIITVLILQTPMKVVNRNVNPVSENILINKLRHRHASKNKINTARLMKTCNNDAGRICKKKNKKHDDANSVV